MVFTRQFWVRVADYSHKLTVSGLIVVSIALAANLAMVSYETRAIRKVSHSSSLQSIVKQDTHFIGWCRSKRAKLRKILPPEHRYIHSNKEIGFIFSRWAGKDRLS